MLFRRTLLFTATAIPLISCANLPISSKPGTLTRAEAKAEACPESVLEAGATPEDCLCVENKLFSLGQNPDALREHTSTTHKLFEDTADKRKIEIGLLRLSAFEQCGLFDEDHTVAKNL